MILSILQFIHDFYAAIMVWAIETGPGVILLFWPTLLAIYYVIVKLGEWWNELIFYIWPPKPKGTDFYSGGRHSEQ